MQSREHELEAFKTHIDLVSYAEAQGYEIDKRRTCSTSVALKNPITSDRIIVGRGSNQHFFYASVHNHQDSGTIIDFCQNRGVGSLGEVRKVLRPWTAASAPPLARTNTGKRPALRPAIVNLEQVREDYAATHPLEGKHAYLTDERRVPVEIYTHAKFLGRIRTDRRGNVLFPHIEANGGVMGFEIKNRDFTGFVKGGVKRLFGSGITHTDKRLVIAESGIDMLSHAALFGVEDGRFVSTGGALNAEQVEMVRSAMVKLPAGGEVLAAMDADDGGEALSEQMEAVFTALGREDITFRRHTPPTPGQDWNDFLQSKGSPAPPELG